MRIHDGFYLDGFTRQDKGEAGAVFVHYEEVTPVQPTVRSTPVTLQQTGALVFSLSVPIERTIPKPKAQRVTACAIVTRTSKNRYQATAYDERRIENFSASGLDELRQMVAEFFKG